MDGFCSKNITSRNFTVLCVDIIRFKRLKIKELSAPLSSWGNNPK